MAIKLFKVDNFHYGIHQEFFIDGEDDLEQIENEYECELGDKAYTPDGTIYMRHSDDFDGDLWDIVKSNSESENSLPAITTDDNGNVLTVVDGVWAKAIPSNGILEVIGQTNAISDNYEYDGRSGYCKVEKIITNFESAFLPAIKNVSITIDGNTYTAPGVFTNFYSCMIEDENISAMLQISDDDEGFDLYVGINAVDTSTLPNTIYIEIPSTEICQPTSDYIVAYTIMQSTP